MYIYIYTHVYMYVYIYIYIYSGLEIAKSGRLVAPGTAGVVSSPP